MEVFPILSAALRSGLWPAGINARVTPYIYPLLLDALFWGPQVGGWVVAALVVVWFREGGRVKELGTDHLQAGRGIGHSGRREKKGIVCPGAWVEGHLGYDSTQYMGGVSSSSSHSLHPDLWCPPGFLPALQDSAHSVGLVVVSARW